ncbi:uncharacterized protein LOC129573479 isoform X2 [Sitodiplosis mosellana]|uniref:uncharacterized protein LOC129573479 isoform X2 n=1 Tax=Sitodiplosis mosellana TaxID=263140 RepID=UPI002443E05E|nr:uncharacterized protein LOC129573479 isoform X2 [Sitodiplosis mosellana]
MRDKMQFYCQLLVVSFVLKTAIAANATASTGSPEMKNPVVLETKNKRQVNQYLRTPGTSASIGIDSGPQVFPLQLSHGIYNQQRVPLYTRRPTTVSKPQIVENEELEPQPQQQQQSILPSYYNYIPDIENDNESPDTVHIDSRHLPVEPRNKVQPYQSTPPQRVQISYSSLAPKQSTPSQTLISEDKYLELIRNTDLVQNSQTSTSKAPFGYVSAAPTTTADNTYNSYSTKTPFSNNEFKKFTSRTHIPSTPSSPVPNLQPENSQHQFVRQPLHYISQPAHFVTTAPQDFGSPIDKDTVRVNLKKYHETVGKTKYDPARGQYHQEVIVKPTKKVISFKPSYQYTSTARTQISNQQSIAQSQPLHYQSVQQITQSEQSKSGQQQASQPQSQYSIVVPQSHIQAQQAYYPSDVNHPFQTYTPQNERLIANNNFEQSGLEQTNLPTGPQQSDSKPNGQPEFRIQYVHHVSTTPNPTPTPRTRFVSDSSQSQLKYELFDSNGNVNAANLKESKIKSVPAPQHVHRPQYSDSPQYYKKIKVQPAAQVQYVPVRTQFHQPSQASPQAQSDLLIPIQPSRSTLFVSQNNGQNESVPRLTQSNPPGHQTHSEPRKPPLPITSPKKPISQAEFQALIDAGYKVQAIPVPIPIPIPADKYKQLQYQQQQQSQQPQQQQQQQRQQHHTQPIQNSVPYHHVNHPAQHTRQATTHYIRYHPKQEAEEGILTSYLKPLIDYIGGPSQ